MVSLSPSQWSTLLGQLDMPLLEVIQVEGDIPRPALLRFLMKHRDLRIVRIRGSVPSDRSQPSRSQIQHFLPNLRTLHAPLAVCCDIIRRASSPSSLWELNVELSRLHPYDPLFHQLLEALRHFQNLDRLGLLLVPSPLDDIPHARPGDWDGHPACELRQVRSLSFRNRGLLSPGDIVSPHMLSFAFLPYSHDRTRYVPTYDHFQCPKKSMWWKTGKQSEWNSLNPCAKEIPPSDLSPSLQSLPQNGQQ
jgi:hypothetical protein